MVQNYVRSRSQIASGKIRFHLQCFGIISVNKDRLATGGVAAIHVTPAVAHHPTLRQINVQFLRRAQEHARLRLPAIAIRRALAGMKTGFHPVNRQLRQQVRVNFFDDFPRQRAAPDIRLVRGDDEQKTGGLQFPQRCRNFGQNFKFRERGRRIRLASALQRAVDDAVTVKKHGATRFRFPLSAFRFHFVLSHFVGATFNFGCETNKCQMTA